jgi:hypothetical protein
MEDLKVSTVRPGRLGEMVKFFYKSWTELADWDSDWLITSEEENVHALLKDNLDFYQALLEPEVSNLALRYIQGSVSANVKHGYTHVFVDDYQSLSRASQLLTNVLAQRSITVGANTASQAEVYDSYPFAEGIDEFIALHENVNITKLTPFESQEKRRITTRKFSTPDQEVEGIAALVKEKIAQENYYPKDMVIVVPQMSWGDYLKGVLAQKGIPSETLTGKVPLNGDIRDIDRSIPLRMYTALRLVANENDALAWRCWLGYGDYLAQSTIMQNLREFAVARDLSMARALGVVMESSTNPFPGSEKLAARSREGKTLLGNTSSLHGLSLLRTIYQSIAFPSGDSQGVKEISYTGAFETLLDGQEAPGILRIFEELCGPIGENDTAEVLLARAKDHLENPRFDISQDTVKIAQAKDFCGMSPKILIYSSFVNGFIPHRDYFDGTLVSPDKKKKLFTDYQRLVDETTAKAHDEVIFTYFTKTDLESAEKLKLKVERIRLENGERMAIISRSDFLP